MLFVIINKCFQNVGVVFDIATHRYDDGKDVDCSHIHPEKKGKLAKYVQEILLSSHAKPIADLTLIFNSSQKKRILVDFKQKQSMP